MKLVSIMLATLMMLLTAAMVVNAEEHAATEAMESGITATEHAAEEAKETVVAVSENATAKAEAATEHVAEAAKEDVADATKTAEKATPGFEGLFALTGLLGAACLLLGRRE
ncbi:MAG: hypothetical protein JW999_07985 [Methanotrichaceae archaeon]|nr:hypothetical protein [Methanotrichaceae archaeon]